MRRSVTPIARTSLVLTEEARRFLRAPKMPAVLHVGLRPELAARMLRYPEINWSELCRVMFRRAVGIPVPESLGEIPWKKSRGVGFSGKGRIGIVLGEELAAKMAVVPGMDWRGYVDFVLEHFVNGIELGRAEAAQASSPEERRALRGDSKRGIKATARRVNRSLPKPGSRRTGGPKRGPARTRTKRRGPRRIRRHTRTRAGPVDPEPAGVGQGRGPGGRA